MENNVTPPRHYFVEVIAQIALALAIGIFVSIALGGAALLLAA